MYRPIISYRQKEDRSKTLKKIIYFDYTLDCNFERKMKTSNFENV